MIGPRVGVQDEKSSGRSLGSTGVGEDLEVVDGTDLRMY